MSYKVDFHIHSYFSDGMMKPTELVRKYKDEEYDMIALTDHDGIDGISEALIAGEALKIKVVPGIELATEYDFDGSAMELHILGFYIDPENQQLKDRLVSIREDRQRRNIALLALLNDMGYPLSMEDLMERPGQTYVGKPNFSRALDRKGYVLENKWEVFDQVEREKIGTKDAIALIKAAGGMAVLAHPMKVKELGDRRSDDFIHRLGDMVRQLKLDGLKGLECYHPSADEHDALALVGIAEQYHLHITEGSDFHGTDDKLNLKY